MTQQSKNPAARARRLARRLSGAAMLQRGYIRTKVRLFCRRCNDVVDTLGCAVTASDNARMACSQCNTWLANLDCEHLYQDLEQMIKPGECIPYYEKKEEE